MDFVMDMQDSRSIRERHPIRMYQSYHVALANENWRPTFKVYKLHEFGYGVFIPRLLSKVRGPHPSLSRSANLNYTSEDCARKALKATYRQLYYYDNGYEFEQGDLVLDRSIELMEIAYRDPEPPFLVERSVNQLVRKPVSAFYLGSAFYLVQKLP